MKETSGKKSGTVKKSCDCVSSFQDSVHGKNMRIHNYTKDGTVRCTVCGKIK